MFRKGICEIFLFYEMRFDTKLSLKLNDKPVPMSDCFDLFLRQELRKCFPSKSE